MLFFYSKSLLITKVFEFSAVSFTKIKFQLNLVKLSNSCTFKLSIPELGKMSCSSNSWNVVNQQKPISKNDLNHDVHA